MNVTMNSRALLPTQGEDMFLTDGGLETTLIYHEGWDLPEFAAFPLLDSATGRAALRTYYERYIHIAKAHEVGLVLESPTWRASNKWGANVGYAPSEIASVNKRAITFMDALRHAYATPATPMVISGCVGPQDDGYSPEERLTVEEAFAYHLPQVQVFAESGADLVTGVTMTYVEEAIGLVRAAESVGIPVVVSFTVETDGALPVGTPLANAIQAVDAATRSAPVYYMVNCAHPTHFADVFDRDSWTRRIGGVRANASRMSHEELDCAETLDAGDPHEFGSLYAELCRRLPSLRVLGGCCGTDHRHVGHVASQCLAVEHA